MLGAPLPAGILAHILRAKFARSADAAVAQTPLTIEAVRALLRHICEQKYDQRSPTGDVYDAYIGFLSGEQQGTMEWSFKPLPRGSSLLTFP